MPHLMQELEQRCEASDRAQAVLRDQLHARHSETSTLREQLVQAINTKIASEQAQNAAELRLSDVKLKLAALHKENDKKQGVLHTKDRLLR